MKNIRLYIVYAIALALLPVLLILIAQFESPADLMTPPSLDGEQGLIQEAFEEATKDKDITLQYPSQGKYRTAYVLYDLDGDRTEEALVFYTLKTEETTVRVTILDKVNGKWSCIYDEPGYGSNVLSIDFTDLNQDGQVEIMTCWNLYESKSSKVLTIHSIKMDKKKNIAPEILVNQSYTFMNLFDSDSDGDNEVLVIWNDTSDQNITKSFASLLKQNDDGSILQIGENAALDASISSYASIHYDNLNGKTVIYLDAYKGEDSMITEILIWDKEKEKLEAPLLDPDTLTNTKTLRTPAIPSYDINGDGKYEVPIDMESSAKSYESEILTDIFAWSTYGEEGFEPITYGIINTSFGYFFMLPSESLENILVYRLPKDSAYTFYWTDDGEERGDPLFTLVASNKEPVDFDFKVISGDNYVYGKLTSAGIDAGFNSELIENCFTFLND